MRGTRTGRAAPVVWVIVGLVLGLIAAGCSEESPAVEDTTPSAGPAVDLTGVEIDVHQEPG